MIKRLSEEDKRIMELLYRENIPVQDIARYLKCNRGTIYDFAYSKGWKRKTIKEILDNEK